MNGACVAWVAWPGELREVTGMADDCPFCRIARGEVRVHEVYRDHRVVAFLDREPIRPGHLQIIPTAHIEYFEALPAEDAGAILRLGQRLAAVQKRVLGVPRVGFLFTGGDIPHTHAHVVPMVEKTDITSRAYIENDTVAFRPAPRAEEGALIEMAERLKSALAQPDR